MNQKIYVDVIVRYNKDAKIIPLVVIGDNGIKYAIDKVTQIIPAASMKAGGCGIRYTCYIQGAMRYLFLEEDRWFIEKGG